MTMNKVNNIKTIKQKMMNNLYNKSLSFINGQLLNTVKDYVSGKMYLSFHIPVSSDAYYNIYKDICIWIKMRNSTAKNIKHINFDKTLLCPESYYGNIDKLICRTQIIPIKPVLYKISKYGWVYIRLSNPSVNTEELNNCDIIVYFIGRDAYANIHDCIQHIHKRIRKEKKHNSKYIRYHTISDTDSDTKYVVKKDDSDIIWSELQDLKKYITAWNGLKDLYKSKHLPHKLSILLYGKSGTGKSSIINYLAGFTNRGIVSIDPNMTTKILNDSLNENKIKDNIIVFEDIDLLFTNTTIVGDNRVVSSSKEEKLHFLLQLFSGINTPDNMIAICTTNYVEELDERLTRPGRFDLVYKIHEFEYLDAMKMCKYYDADPTVVLQGMGERINPAQLQTYCIRYAAKKNMDIIKKDLS